MGLKKFVNLDLSESPVGVSVLFCCMGLANISQPDGAACDGVHQSRRYRPHHLNQRPQ